MKRWRADSEWCAAGHSLLRLASPKALGAEETHWGQTKQSPFHPGLSLGTTKGKAAPLNPLWIQTRAQSRRQVNHLKSPDDTVTRIICVVYSSGQWWTPRHFKDVLICQVNARLKSSITGLSSQHGKRSLISVAEMSEFAALLRLIALQLKTSKMEISNWSLTWYFSIFHTKRLTGQSKH